MKRFPEGGGRIAMLNRVKNQLLTITYTDTNTTIIRAGLDLGPA